MNESSARIRIGVKRLLEHIKRDDARYLEVLTYQRRLEGTFEQMRFGDSENLRFERNRVLHELDRIAVEVTGNPLQSLWGIDLAGVTVGFSEKPTSPFLGPMPFRASDAPLFFGRSRYITALIRALQDNPSPILVINGLSGCGKTSLLRAGVMPELNARDISAAYTSILDSPELDVVRGLVETFGLDPGYDDIVQAIDAVVLATQKPLILIVDQVERCFTSAAENVQRLDFWRSMSRIARGEIRYPVKVALAVRSDWLHAFQSVASAPLDASLFFNFLFLVEPLRLEEAKEALARPLDVFNVEYDPALIDQVAQDLVIDDGYVNPPQLQIVGYTLYQHMRERAAGGPEAPLRLTLEDYHQLRGARVIIRDHLIKIVNLLGPNARSGWQILLRLVGRDDVRVNRGEDELLGNLSPAQFTPIIEYLVSNALVVREVSAADDHPVYTLTHDYLIEEVRNIVSEDLQLQAWRTAEHYLNNGLADWREARAEGQPEIFLDRERYQVLWAHREGFGGLTNDANFFLLLTALQHGQPSFAHWLNSLPAERLPDAYAAIGRHCLDPDESIREPAAAAVAAAVRQGELGPEHQARLAGLLLADETAASAPAAVDRPRHVLAPLLWTLRRHVPSSELSWVVPTVGVNWARRHRSQIASMLIGSLLVAGIVLGGWLLSVRLRGTWTALPPLYAGNLTAAALSPQDGDTVYVAALRGPGIGDGATVMRRTGGSSWEILGKSLSPLAVKTLAVAEDDGRLRLYAGIFSRGILRSDDQGASWQVINAGLTSYDIRSLIVHPERPHEVYAAAADYRGVFVSTDGGDRWQDISGETLFGASILTLAYSRADGGRLIAGAADGRLFVRADGAEEWEQTAAFPGSGSVREIAVEPQEGRYVYAGTAAGQLLLSPDAGANWAPMGQAPGLFSITSVAVAAGQPQTVYVVGFGIGGYVTWRSEDYGANWRKVGSDDTVETEQIGDFTREENWLLPHAQDAGTFYSRGTGGFFETHDGGATWRFDRRLGAPIAAVSRAAVSPLADGARYLAVGGAVFSDLGGETPDWQRGRDLPALTVRTLLPDPQQAGRVYAGLFIPNRWSVYVSEDYGANWTPTAKPEGVAEKYFHDIAALAIGRTDAGSVLYAGTNGCGVIRSEDGGRTWITGGWAECNLPDDQPKNLIDLVVSPVDAGVVYAAADSTRVYTSHDRGTTWQLNNLKLTNEIDALSADPAVAGRLYLVAGTEGFWRSDDSGGSWTRYEQGLGEASLVDLAVTPDGDAIYAAARNGQVWRSGDGGQSWASVQEDLVVKSASSLAYDPLRDELLLSTWEEGVYRYRPGSLWPQATDSRQSDRPDKEEAERS